MNNYTAYTTTQIADAVERITKFRRMCESHELCQLTHVELDELERLAEIGRATENIRRKQVDNESNSNHIRNRNGYSRSHGRR